MANVFTNLSKDQIVRAAKGNPGAAMAMMDMINMGLSESVERAIQYGILGTDFYVLYSDLCGKDGFVAAVLIENCPKEILIDASGRQDFSGRELVKQWVK